MSNFSLTESTLQEIEILRREILELEKNIQCDHPSCQSLLNLKQYLVLREKDRTPLQEKLFLMSLSSLGRSTAHVAASINTLYDQLNCSQNHKPIPESEAGSFLHATIPEAIKLASDNRSVLFGGESSDKLSKQKTSVMVTLPSNAADDDGLLIYQLADAGVRIFRINTAHDNAVVWRAMADIIGAINKERESDNQMKIFVDLAGPKIRTGSIRKRELPVKIGKNRQETEVMLYPDIQEGMTTSPGYISLGTLEKTPARICISKKLFKHLENNTPLAVIDTNGKKATILITELTEEYAKGVINKKVFLDKHAKLIKKEQESNVLHTETQTEVIRLMIGDKLIITEREMEGHAAIVDESGQLIAPATISCSFKNIASFVAIDDKVFIDDGKIGLKVTARGEGRILCEVTNAKSNGTVLKEEKGINFPDSHINTAALTENDRINLLSVIDFADHFSVSFCQSAQDVKEIHDLLIANGRSDAGIIAKIETKRAVTHMPQILEALLLCEKSGVMIARGDLAIEVGFTQMAAIQEELLDICNAAHVPVIWATQVLESQMKNNLPSRAEISDAAISGRAECVMLNKGPFAIHTIDILKDILHEMHLLFKRNSKLLGENRLWKKS